MSSQHLAIFDALKKGSSSEADRLTRSHLMRQREVLKQLADSNAKELQA